MSEFTGVVTLAGQAKIAASIGGDPLVVTQIAVGDGNGAPITPNEAMVALVNEVWRAGIDAGAPDDVDPTIYRFTVTIPEEAGPFDIREIGAFDEDGDLIAVARHPLVEKRTPGGGAAVAIETDIIFPVSETANVTVVIAPDEAVSIQNMLRVGFIAAESATLTAPPAEPEDGAVYVVPAGAGGAWDGLTHQLVQWNGDGWSTADAPVRTIVGVAGGDFIERTATGWRAAKFGVRYALATGSANALIVALDPQPAAYAAGMDLWVKIANTNTGAVTVNVNALGNRAVQRPDGSALAAGDLVAGGMALLSYDGAAFQLCSAGAQLPDATATVKGKVEYATNAEAIAGVSTTHALTPANLAAVLAGSSVPDATTTVKGKAELATNAETVTGTDTERVTTPAGVKAAIDAAIATVTVPDASETVKGKVEKATQAETLAGTDATRYVAPVDLFKALQANGLLYGDDTSASANVCTLTFTPAPAAYFDGMAVAMKANGANTGSATLSVNGLGAVTIKGGDGANLVGGELENDRIYILVYDTGSFHLVTSVTPDASETVKGKAERATDAEALAGTDTGRFVSPASLAKVVHGGGLIRGADTSAGSNQLTITPSPALAAYADGQLVAVKVQTTNTGSTTLNVSGLGAVTIKGRDGNNLVGGELQDGRVYLFAYDGTNFQLLTGPSATGSTAGSGRIRFETGLILQWGAASVTSTGNGTTGEATVAFPIVFPTACVHVWPAWEQDMGAVNGGSIQAYVRLKDVGGCQLGLDESNSVSTITRTVHYIALGY